MLGNYQIATQLVAPQEGHSSMELVVICVTFLLYVHKCNRYDKHTAFVIVSWYYSH
jgi:hypothetical protein